MYTGIFDKWSRLVSYQVSRHGSNTLILPFELFKSWKLLFNTCKSKI